MVTRYRAFHSTLFGVQFSMVRPAQQLQVVEIRCSAVFPMVNVVGFAVVGWSVASGGSAVPVADDEGFPLGVRDRARRAADVEDLGVAGDEDGGDLGVAEEPVEGGLGDVAEAAFLDAELVDELGCRGW